MMQCSNCGELKPAEAFRTNPQRRECRACESAKRMARLKRSPESRMRAIEAYRRYREQNPAPPRKRDYKAEYQKHRHRKLIRAETKRMILRGELPTAASCAACGGPDPEVHHRSYNRADDIIWLCRKCHSKEHRIDFSEVMERHDAAIRNLSTKE